MTPGPAGGFASTGTRNHPGHPDQKSHGRKGSADETGTRLTVDDFTRPGEGSSHSVNEYAGNRLAAAWDVSEGDLDAWIAESEPSVREHFKDKSFDEKREGMARGQIQVWRGGSGGPEATAAITGVADRLGAKYKLTESEQTSQDYIRERPAVQRAMESFGAAMYGQTQSWFAERGITHVDVERVTFRGEAKDNERPFTSWSATGSAGYYDDRTGSTTRRETVPVERVMSIPPTGYGTLAEMELVLLPPLPASAQNRASAVRIRNVDPRSIDLSKVQRDWERALDALLDQWGGITAYQRDQIVDQVRSAVTSNDVAALARLSVSTTAAEQALVEAMTDMSLRAAERVVEEARAQGVRIDPVATDTAPFALTAAALSVLLAQGLTNSAGREALRRWSPTATGDEVSAAVGEHLESLSDSFLEANLGNALTSAQNAGRIETMMAFPDVAVYASERNDQNTCSPCSEVDGKWIGNVSDPDFAAKYQAVYPNGGYVYCEGGPRCRGNPIGIWRPRQTATVEEVL